MTSFKKWDVVLVPFPFTDLSTSKKRPALIISPDGYNKFEDVVVMFITSNVKASPKPGDYKLKEWKKSGLPKVSMTRMRFSTIQKTIIIKKIGSFQDKDIAHLKKEIMKFFS